MHRAVPILLAAVMLSWLILKSNINVAPQLLYLPKWVVVSAEKKKILHVVFKGQHNKNSFIPPLFHHPLTDSMAHSYICILWGEITRILLFGVSRDWQKLFMIWRGSRTEHWNKRNENDNTNILFVPHVCTFCIPAFVYLKSLPVAEPFVGPTKTKRFRANQMLASSSS